MAGNNEVRAKRDLRQELTDKFVAALDAGKIPWERPWTAINHGSPRNAFSDRRYSGGNRLFLSLAMLDAEWGDPRFGTFNQIRQAGGMVKKGEHGIPIELWRERPFWERRDVTVLDGGSAVRIKGLGATRELVELAGGRTVAKARLRVEHGGNKLSWQAAELTLTQRVSQVHVVFNVAQADGLNLEPLPSVDHGTTAHERLATIQAAMAYDGLQFGVDPKQAFYRPSEDKVYMPPVEAFHSQEGHAGTLLHEIGHATGAAQRLNREGIASVDTTDREKYAREELRAEIFSAFMAAETGISWDRSQHEGYVQGWAEALKKDKNEIFRAAADAGAAVDYVIAREEELVREREHRERAAEHAVGTSDDLSPLQKIGRRQDSLLDRPPISIERAKRFASEDVALLQSIPADSLDRYCAAVDMADIARDHPAYGSAVGEISEEVADEISRAKAEDMRRSLEKEFRKGAVLVSPAPHEDPAEARAEIESLPEGSQIGDLPLHEQQQHPEWGAASRQTFRGKEILIVPGAMPGTLKAVGRTPEANEFLERRGGAWRGSREIPFDRNEFVAMREAIENAGLGLEVRHDLRRQDPELGAMADQFAQQSVASEGAQRDSAIDASGTRVRRAMSPRRRGMDCGMDL